MREHADALRTCGHLERAFAQVRKVFHREVGDDVAEAVHLQDGPCPGAASGARRFIEIEAQIVRDRLAETGRGDAAGQMRGHWRKNVTAVDRKSTRLNSS